MKVRNRKKRNKVKKSEKQVDNRDKICLNDDFKIKGW